MFQAKVLENIETHFMFNIFLSKSLPFFLDNVENCFRAGRATDDSMAHELCMVDT